MLDHHQLGIVWAGLLQRIALFGSQFVFGNVLDFIVKATAETHHSSGIQPCLAGHVGAQTKLLRIALLVAFRRLAVTDAGIVVLAVHFKAEAGEVMSQGIVAVNQGVLVKLLAVKRTEQLHDFVERAVGVGLGFLVIPQLIVEVIELDDHAAGFYPRAVQCIQLLVTAAGLTGQTEVIERLVVIDQQFFMHLTGVIRLTGVGKHRQGLIHDAGGFQLFGNPFGLFERLVTGGVVAIQMLDNAQLKKVQQAVGAIGRQGLFELVLRRLKVTLLEVVVHGLQARAVGRTAVQPQQ